jgi:hypothetical protein
MTSTGLKRNTNDKFYTNPETVNLCMSTLLKVIAVDKTDLLIEPSAGAGAFIDNIKKITNNYLFIDLMPEHPEIIKQDFLKYEITNNLNRVIIIGNPPFGRQSSQAIKFIKKSCEIADIFAFILPMSFKKDSLKRHIPNNFHNLIEIELKKDSFNINGKIHNVPCVFQIWKKESHLRELLVKVIPIGYTFIKKPDEYLENCISVRRVGINAGKIYTVFEEILSLSIQSHYFIKFDKVLNSNEINKLSNIKYEHNTVGPKSISKPEIIQAFNTLLGE